MLRTATLVRLGLHPNDAHYPRTVAHFQRLIEKLLATREPMTKSSFAQKWRAASNRQMARDGTQSNSLEFNGGKKMISG
jgi:hypothetical protein